MKLFIIATVALTTASPVNQLNADISIDLADQSEGQVINEADYFDTDNPVLYYKYLETLPDAELAELAELFSHFDEELLLEALNPAESY